MSETMSVLDLPGIKYASLAHPGVLEDTRGWFRVIQVEPENPDNPKSGWYWFPIGGWTGRPKGPPRGPFETMPDAYLNRCEEYAKK
jgi:hypothetical protein